MPRKYTIEEARAAFAEVGNELLEEEYIGVKRPMRYRCKCGRTQPEIKPKRFDHLLNGHYYCKCCGVTSSAIQKRIDFSIIQKSFEKRKYILLTNASEYKNNTSKLYFICPNGHNHHITWSEWNKKHGCEICAMIDLISKGKKRKIPFDAIKNHLKKIGYDIITTEKEYINTRYPIRYKCNICNREKSSTYHRLIKPTRMGCQSCSIYEINKSINITIIRSEEDFIRDLERLVNDNSTLQTSPKRRKSRRTSLQ